jgi:hypothetical protein
MRCKNIHTLLLSLLAGTGLLPMPSLAAPPLVFQDGSSTANAVPIKATNERAGVTAEYRWIGEHFPGYKRGAQALLNRNGRVYDSIEIVTAAGERKKIYFDITDFFGKS